MSIIFDSNGKFVKQTLLGCTIRSLTAQRTLDDNSGPVSYSATLQQEEGQTFLPDLSIVRGIGEQYEIDIGLIQTSGSIDSWNRKILGPDGSGSITVQMTESVRILSTLNGPNNKTFEELEQEAITDLINSENVGGGSAEDRTVIVDGGTCNEEEVVIPGIQVDAINKLLPGRSLDEKIEFVRNRVSEWEASWNLSEKRRREYIPATIEKLKELHIGEIVSLSEGVDKISDALASHLSGREALTPEEIAVETFSSTKYTLVVSGPPKIAMIQSGMPIFITEENHKQDSIVVDFGKLEKPDTAPTAITSQRLIPTMSFIKVQEQLPNSLSLQFSTNGVTTTYTTEKLSNSSAVNSTKSNAKILDRVIKEEEKKACKAKERVKKACEFERNFDANELDKFPEEDDFKVCSEASKCLGNSASSSDNLYDYVDCEDIEKRARSNYIAKKRSFDKQKPASGSGVIVSKTLLGPFYQVRRLNNKDINPLSFSGFILDGFFLAEWQNVRNMAEPPGSFGYLLPGQRVNIQIFQDDPRADPTFFMETPLPPLVGKIIGNNNGRIYTVARVGGSTPDSWSSILNVGEEPGASKGYIPLDTLVQVSLNESFVPFIQFTPPVFAPPL